MADWVGGIRRFDLKGGYEPPRVGYPYLFDAAVADGDDAVIYTRFGTKGLVLRAGSVLRELNRSFYYADAYDYPITVFRLDSGRKVIGHCPEDCNRLEIEDLETGERLTAKSSRQSAALFHSRLSVSPNGRYLMSAGWLWHPLDQINIYDIAEGLKSPEHLDGPGVRTGTWADKVSACWTHDKRLIFGISQDEDEEDETPAPKLRFYDVAEGLTRTLALEEQVGQIMPVGEDYLLNLYDHPKLIDLRTGAVVQAWPDIPCGRRTSSICIPKPDFMPTLAFDPQMRRCAIATEQEIFVLMFD
ncbi:hypothetical protein [Asticcacaulis sp. AC402]|uniref:hypothetical protein n=1 Tax=Asticcacaulis sp. AC402 TaxID=1282361 RepID=UPI0012DF321A|nr:hypothetical protein [Asticcacaulis sp. AC402]